jgi:hypothetical protein
MRNEVMPPGRGLVKEKGWGPGGPCLAVLEIKPFKGQRGCCFQKAEKQNHRRGASAENACLIHSPVVKRRLWGGWVHPSISMPIPNGESATVISIRPSLKKQ